MRWSVRSQPCPCRRPERNLRCMPLHQPDGRQRLDDRRLRPCFGTAYGLHHLIKVLGKEGVVPRCRAHRKRRTTPQKLKGSQGLDKMAHRVAARAATAASRRLDDASSIAYAAAPNTRVPDGDADRKQSRNRLSSLLINRSGAMDALENSKVAVSTFVGGHIWPHHVWLQATHACAYGLGNG